MEALGHDDFGGGGRNGNRNDEPAHTIGVGRREGTGHATLATPGSSRSPSEREWQQAGGALSREDWPHVLATRGAGARTPSAVARWHKAAWSVIAAKNLLRSPNELLVSFSARVGRGRRRSKIYPTSPVLGRGPGVSGCLRKQSRDISRISLRFQDHPKTGYQLLPR